jgi:hypothetical protein
VQSGNRGGRQIAQRLRVNFAAILRRLKDAATSRVVAIGAALLAFAGVEFDHRFAELRIDEQSQHDLVAREVAWPFRVCPVGYVARGVDSKGSTVGRERRVLAR